MRRIAAALVLALAACTDPAPKLDAPATDIDLPAMRRFGAAQPEPPRRSNDEIAQDFIDLSFRLESGREIGRFSRFTGPMTVRLTGTVPRTAPADLAALLGRLRDEAGLALSLTNDPGAGITVEFLPRRQLQSRAPDAACFVAPRVGSWAEFRRAGRLTLDWAEYARRERLAVFIPADTAPQEIRDCLHEELAQALGPLNDLYRLQDSVFNDDNIHTTLTGFDMLILRATYAPDLTPGMTREAVAMALPGILARLNPGGERSGNPPAQTPRAFGAAIARALGPGTSPAGRRAAAEEAFAIARDWQDARTGFALLTLGRLSAPGQSERAFDAFRQASALFHAQGLPLHQAHADMQLALFALAEGAWEPAAALTAAALPAAVRDQNASLMAGLMMVRAEALARMGKAEEAARLRLDSLGWARYGMLSDQEVKRRLTTIAAIAARTEPKVP